MSTRLTELLPESAEPIKKAITDIQNELKNNAFLDKLAFEKEKTRANKLNRTRRVQEKKEMMWRIITFFLCVIASLLVVLLVIIPREASFSIDSVIICICHFITYLVTFLTCIEFIYKLYPEWCPFLFPR